MLFSGAQRVALLRVTTHLMTQSDSRLDTRVITDKGYICALDRSVAGDVHANCTNPGHRSKRTAPLVEQYPDALVIPLGDNAGQPGTVAEHACYDQSWGRFKSRTYPTIGNTS
jgi:hypothetical protein